MLGAEPGLVVGLKHDLVDRQQAPASLHSPG